MFPVPRVTRDASATLKDKQNVHLHSLIVDAACGFHLVCGRFLFGLLMVFLHTRRVFRLKQFLGFQRYGSLSDHLDV